ncbi:MAG TPA: hypothetical protein PK867_24620 [Pirellulales bacterium]|nr:hypothetical protein [Pirellulales bacterium]
MSACSEEKGPIQLAWMVNKIRLRGSTILNRSIGWLMLAWLLSGGLALLGCRNTPVDLQTGPAPLREPPPKLAQAESYEDSLTGGQVFAMYCSSCHNARPLAERPFSSYQNVAAHMRVRANLTGKEYAKLMEFLRRWHDVPPPNPPIEPPPKRFFFNQPIPEQQEEIPAPKPMPPVPVAVPSQ